MLFSKFEISILCQKASRQNGPRVSCILNAVLYSCTKYVSTYNIFLNIFFRFKLYNMYIWLILLTISMMCLGIIIGLVKCFLSFIFGRQSLKDKKKKAMKKKQNQQYYLFFKDFIYIIYIFLNKPFIKPLDISSVVIVFFLYFFSNKGTFPKNWGHPAHTAYRLCSHNTFILQMSQIPAKQIKNIRVRIAIIYFMQVCIFL